LTVAEVPDGRKKSSPAKATWTPALVAVAGWATFGMVHSARPLVFVVAVQDWVEEPVPTVKRMVRFSSGMIASC